MEGSPHINVPHVDTQSLDFDPNTKLPDDLLQLQNMGISVREKADAALRRACALMDSAALRVTATVPLSQAE